VNDIGIPTWTLDPAEGSNGAPVAFTLLEGRAPAEGEAVIGPKNKDDLGINIGDTVKIGTKEQAVRIVGIGLFPQDVHAGFDEGLWITRADLKTAQPLDPNDENQLPRSPGVAIRLEPGADPAAVAAEIGAAVGGDFVVQPNDIPSELTNLKYVRTLPLVLAVFLALLALAALLHVLTTVARTRRSEFAVLRALGMTRRSTRAVMNVQGTTVAVVGLLVGIPVGVLVGRAAWNLIAESVPIANVSVQQWLALVTVVVVALLAANLLALLPGWRAARLQPAEVLRSE
jgi:ABC-type antimicrobial peptide transport system permease subunit